MKNLKAVLMKIMVIDFSIFFIIILFNTTFFNRTTDIDFKIPVMIFGTLLAYILIFVVYCIYKKKNLKFLDKTLKKRYVFIFIILIFIIQCALAILTASDIGWDCKFVVGSSLLASLHVDYNYTYFSTYPNNIGILLLFTYITKIFIIITGKSLYDIRISNRNNSKYYND